MSLRRGKSVKVLRERILMLGSFGRRQNTIFSTKLLKRKKSAALRDFNKEKQPPQSSWESRFSSDAPRVFSSIRTVLEINCKLACISPKDFEETSNVVSFLRGDLVIILSVSLQIVGG